MDIEDLEVGQRVKLNGARQFISCWDENDFVIAEAGTEVTVAAIVKDGLQVDEGTTWQFAVVTVQSGDEFFDSIVGAPFLSPADELQEAV